MKIENYYCKRCQEGTLTEISETKIICTVCKLESNHENFNLD